MTAFAVIFLPLLVVWVVAVWHLGNPVNRASAMPPPPSPFLVGLRVAALATRLVTGAFVAAVVPAMRAATEAMEAFHASLGRVNAALLVRTLPARK